MGDPEHPETSGRARMEKKWDTSVKSRGPEHPERETSAQSRRQVGNKCKITSGGQVGDKYKIMRPEAPSGKQVGDKRKNHAAQTTQSGRQARERSEGQVQNHAAQNTQPERKAKSRGPRVRTPYR